MSRLVFYTGLIALAVLLSLTIAAVPPRFGKDAQFYLQEGQLWSEGQVTFGGSLMGDRHLAILAYYLPRRVLWDSIDALSVTLGAIFLCFALAVIALATRVAGVGRAGFVAAAGSMVIAFLVPHWTIPATDNLFVVVIVVAMLVYASILHTADARAAGWWMMVLGLWCGLSTGIRPEGLLVFVACALALLPALPAWPRLRQRIGGIVFGGICFALASAVQASVFPLWTGVAKPDQLRGFFLFFDTAVQSLDPRAGPASARLHALSRAAERDLAERGMTRLVTVQYRVAGMVYEQEGGRGVSELFARAGLESVVAHPGKLVASTLANLRLFLTAPPGELIIDWRNHEARREETRRRLAALDQLRIAVSPLFGHDAYWPVATLAAGEPAYRVDWPYPTGHLPAWAFDTLLVLAAGWVLVRRRWSGILAMSLCLLAMVMTLTAFSTGYILRYWLTWSVVLVVASAIELAGSVRAPSR